MRTCPKQTTETRSHQCRKFLRDLIKTYRKHGLSLGHQDHQGSFLVKNFDPRCEVRLLGAQEERGKKRRRSKDVLRK